ncbi:hypothetical protein TNCV_1496571 [Trichonephila clavipes]|nr:hypothetical protein TNCV_1496571 [Trichonephila clavipes]
MGYARETNCSPFAPTKLRYRTEASSQLSPQLIHHLIASMVNRCAECLAVRARFCSLPHSKVIVKDWYHSNIIELLSSPGNSPDLDPIENLWHSLKTLLRMRYP